MTTNTMTIANPRWLQACGALAVAFALAAPAQAADYKGCGSLDVDKVVMQSKRARLAQFKLIDEFSPRIADINGQVQRIHELERLLQTPPEGLPADQRAAAASELWSAQPALTAARTTYEADLARRTQQVLSGVLQEAGAAYQAIGTKRGFARLYQQAQPEPIFPPAPDAVGVPCPDKTDVTDEVIQALDQGL